MMEVFTRNTVEGAADFPDSYWMNAEEQADLTILLYLCQLITHHLAHFIARFNASTDLQQFSNQHLPSPPTVLVLPMLIPLSTCHEAAKHLIQVLGGPEQARKIAGGTEWWQVRGIRGIEGEWIAEKKQLKEEEKKSKSKLGKNHGKDKEHAEEGEEEREGANMTEEEKDRAYKRQGYDGMRCMLYIHGGQSIVASYCTKLNQKLNHDASDSEQSTRSVLLSVRTSPYCCASLGS